MADKLQGYIPPRIGEAAPLAGETEGLAGSPRREDLRAGKAEPPVMPHPQRRKVPPENAPRLAGRDLLRRNMTEPGADHVAREAGDLGGEPPVDPRRRNLRRADSRAEARADHRAPPASFSTEAATRAAAAASCAALRRIARRAATSAARSLM